MTRLLYVNVVHYICSVKNINTVKNGKERDSGTKNADVFY